MAIQVLQQPKQYIPAYNDMVYVVSSTNNGQTNFNYIASLYIGNDIISLKAAADPTYGSGVFNVGRIVENYVNSDISTSTYGFQINTNSFKSFYLKIGEEYGASSGVIQYPNLYRSETRYAWNAEIDFLKFQSYNDSGYIVDTSTRTLNSSGTQYIQSSQDAWQYFLTQQPTAVNYAVVKTYNSSDAVIQTASFINPYQTSGTIGHHFVRFGCGTNNLNLAGTPITGAQPLITSSVSYYTIQFSDGIDLAGAVYTSHAYRYNIVDADCKYPTYRLHYLNQLGAFDSVNFTKVSRPAVEIKRDRYMPTVGGLTSSSTYGYSKSDRITKQFNTELKDNIKLSTDWLSEATSNQLEELVTSPEIYLHDATHGLISVTITDPRYEKRTAVVDRLIRLEVNIEYGYNRYRQRD